MSLSLLSSFLFYRGPFHATIHHLIAFCDGGTKPNSLYILYVLVSFAAVIGVVTQRFSPLAAVSGEERCVTTVITAAKETRLI